MFCTHAGGPAKHGDWPRHAWLATSPTVLAPVASWLSAVYAFYKTLPSEAQTRHCAQLWNVCKCELSHCLSSRAANILRDCSCWMSQGLPGSCACCFLDLEDFASVRAFASSQDKELKKRKQALSVLINNGGEFIAPARCYVAHHSCSCGALTCMQSCMSSRSSVYADGELRGTVFEPRIGIKLCLLAVLKSNCRLESSHRSFALFSTWSAGHC